MPHAALHLSLHVYTCMHLCVCVCPQVKESFKDVLERTRDTLHNTLIADDKTRGASEPAMAPEDVPPADLTSNTEDMIKQGQISA